MPDYRQRLLAIAERSQHLALCRGMADIRKIAATASLLAALQPLGPEHS